MSLARLKRFWETRSFNVKLNIIVSICTIITTLIALKSCLLDDSEPEQFSVVITQSPFSDPTVISTEPATGEPTPTLAATRTPLPFPKSDPGEFLILVSTFYRTEGVIDTAIQDEIKRAIQGQIDLLKLQDVRVEVEPMSIRSNDRSTAQSLAANYNAAQIIWGENTGVRVEVNFLSPTQPDFEAADVRITETQRTQVANPSSYGKFVVEDLPNQLVFLSLYSLSQIYLSDGQLTDLQDSITLLEQALASISTESHPSIQNQQTAANFDLGWLYQTSGDLESAEAFYEAAIELFPEYSNAYNNLGLISLEKGEVGSAIFYFDTAIRLNPDNARAYNNRAITRYKTGNIDGTISDLSNSISLRESPRTYLNRGLVYQYLGDYEHALSDFNKAIDISPSYALSYYRRGRAVYRHFGDCSGAITDYEMYLELSPDSVDARKVSREIEELAELKAKGQCH